MAKITTKKSVKTKQLTTEEKYWNTVDQYAHYQIADLLNQCLPLPNLRQKENFDLAQDANYRTIVTDLESVYEKLPTAPIIAEQIAYEYLLQVSKYILRGLRDFTCHDPAYFDNLSEN